jgi:hypothetical protein
MKKSRLAFVIWAAAFGLLTGCATEEMGPYAPQIAGVNNLEDHAKFVLLDKVAYHSVTCQSLQETRYPDGRLQVLANLQNLQNHRIQMQVNCVFKDAQGFSVEDTPFQTVFLDENAQETLKFISANDKAQRYTIRVRTPR